MTFGGPAFSESVEIKEGNFTIELEAWGDTEHIRLSIAGPEGHYTIRLTQDEADDLADSLNGAAAVCVARKKAEREP